MDGYRCRVNLLAMLGLFALSGAACPNMVRQPLPRVLPPSPTLDQVVQVVNNNSVQIQSFSTTQAQLHVPGAPALRASVAYQRERNFRLRANMPLTGPEVDLGSNPNLFWFWIRRNQPPGVYYCRHEEFANCPARQMVPIEPQWLVEALGVTQFGPSDEHQGPFPLAGDRLEIRSTRQTPEGLVTKVTVVDGSQGWVLEQHIYDTAGQLRASAVASHHRRDPLTGLIMPESVEINCPADQFSMRVELGAVQINRLTGNPAELWAMPQVQGTPMVNLCNPNWQAANSRAVVQGPCPPPTNGTPVGVTPCNMPPRVNQCPRPAVWQDPNDAWRASRDVPTTAETPRNYRR